MAVTNNTMILKRELMTRILKELSKGEGVLRDNIDRIPYIMRPRDGEHSRCCIYKDRAVLKYRAMSILGFSVDEEVDEMTTLAEYTDMAFAREKVAREPLSVMTEACSACVKTNYVVTNMCRGCVGRACMMSCNKGAINFENGQAHIDHSKCVNCGLCQKSCPFHAIIYIPVPCEEECPVGAISKDERGKEHIDPTKCIYCGRCISACPFGAVMERSHIIDIHKAINSSRKVIAIVAPAIAGQFKSPLQNILAAIGRLGFDEVVEVAKGADVTTRNEAAEFIEKMEKGEPFMTTSCCPSYYMLAARHLPEIKPFVSHTRSPMVYAAQIVKEENPDAAVVFVGPCLAKRYEGYHDPNIDYVLSFEEVGTMFVAAGVNPMEESDMALDATINPTSRGYAASAGVMNAVAVEVGGRAEIRPIVIDGITKQTIRDLRGYAKSCPGNMVEVMACEGGCVNGCNVIANPKIATRQVKEYAK
ncbi:Periplasmic [Fe] hydrogenase [Mucinivorans hirudinis]|uniref:Periplasmic [Fe] hydrogenase n=1 Tax=Mucinivorans hirudinis TaxID=1433126 RepID=A0A060R635_9BACT|nr:Periplasmic [Fe] hydrogenase [Mucinivorans hirudinis]